MFRERVWTKDYSRQIINTGHQSFDKQVSSINRGACIGSTQFSAFIRKESTTKGPVGQSYEKGFLRQHDLKAFKLLPFQVEQKLNELKEKSVYLYHFFYFKGVKITVGYVITDPEDHSLIYSWHNQTEKNRKVIEECISYITPIK